MSLGEKFWVGLAFVLIIWFHLYGILMVFVPGFMPFWPIAGMKEGVLFFGMP